MKLAAFALMMGLFSVPVWGQEYCGIDPSPEFRALFEQELVDKPLSKSTSKAIAIPVSINLITNGRQGNYSNTVVATMLNNLNWGFRNTPFQFHLARLKRVNNKKWFQNCAFGTGNHVAMTKKLALDPRYYVNVYVCNMGDPRLLGLGSLPGFPFPANDKRQSVLVSPKTLPHGLDDPRYSTYGLITVHEVGHYLGLLHTFQDGCFDGDGVLDTPAQAEPTHSCPESINTCPEAGNDDVWNFMNYSEDFCQDHFTPGQTTRMISVVQTFRPGLVQ